MRACTINFLNDIIAYYRVTRRTHGKKWLTTSSIFGRVRGNEVTYDKLRICDFEFFEQVQRIIHAHVILNSLLKNDIDEAIISLKNHRSIIGERDFFLVVYAAFISVMLLIPRDSMQSWIIVGIATLFGIIALFERWNMKQHDAMYNEIITILENESKEMANQCSHENSVKPTDTI